MKELFSMKSKILVLTLCLSVTFCSFSLSASALGNKETISQSAGEVLQGIFSGNTYEIELSEKNGMGNQFGFHFPDFVWVDNTLYAYYIKWTKGKAGVGLATSTDAINFTDQGTVLYPDPETGYDGYMASFPGVWYEDGTFYMAYECNQDGNNGDIALAISTDGKNFEKKGLIIQYNRDLQWQYYNVGTPDLFKEGDMWYVTFHAFGINIENTNPVNRNNCDNQIGVAYGTDLMNLTVHPQPILKASTVANAPDSGTLGRRDIIKYGDYYYMVYEISSDAVEIYYDFSGSKWGHAFARSKDMINWEKAPNLLYEATEVGYDHDGPAWMVMGDEVFVYYRNRNNNTNAVQLKTKFAEKTDETTKVRALVNAAAEFAAPQVTEGDFVTHLDEKIGVTDFRIYDLQTTLDGHPSSPAVPAAIFIPVPPDWETDRLSLLKLAQNGELIEISDFVITDDRYVSFESDSLGQYAVTASIPLTLGDANLSGNISTSDALLALLTAVGKSNLNKNQFYCADVDANGSVNTNDALLILQYTVNSIHTFPTEQK